MGVARWRWVLVVLALGATGAACGSDEPTDDKMSTGKAGSGGGQQFPTNTELNGSILFSPVYSSYNGGANTFKVPVTVKGYQGVTWTTDKPDLVLIEELNENSAMLTTRGAGTATIYAQAGQFGGSTTLTITESTAAEWELGKTRYMNGVALPPIDRSMIMGMGFQLPDDLSCQNCHGSGAQALAVEHTPQQTGGYSDEQLVGIFTMGQKPMGSKWNTPIPPFIYTMLHTWTTASEEEKNGLVAYLRSITPAAQGDLDFGGLINDDEM